MSLIEEFLWWREELHRIYPAGTEANQEELKKAFRHYQGVFERMDDGERAIAVEIAHAGRRPDRASEARSEASFADFTESSGTVRPS